LNNYLVFLRFREYPKYEDLVCGWKELSTGCITIKLGFGEILNASECTVNLITINTTTTRSMPLADAIFIITKFCSPYQSQEFIPQTGYLQK
jgi:hypothetical protein